jgi:peptidoglycan/LPS O-acetylase OafA/YrhL
MSQPISPTPQTAIAGYPDREIFPGRAKPQLALIQASRGMAALLVLLFHVTQLSETKLYQPFCFNLFRFGGAGVDFFFVLSGFIIFFVHRSDIGHRDRFQSFAIKRLIRVYPLYWIVTLVLLPAYFLVPSFGYGYENQLTAILRSLFLIPQEHAPILTVGWSLCYEVLFYTMFALVILLPFNISFWIISLWISGSILNTVLDSVFLIKSHFAFQFLFGFHNLEFFVGCLVAYLVLHRFRRCAFFLLIFGSTLFLLAGITQSYHLLQLHPAIAYGLPSSLILVGVASLDFKQIIKPSPLLSYLGDASYSIYLTHYPCLSAALKLALVFNLFSVFGHGLTFAVLILITLAFGCLTYAKVEKPLIVALRKQLLSQPIRKSCQTL